MTPEEASAIIDEKFKCIAMDEDGEWFAYENTDIECNDGVWASTSSHCSLVCLPIEYDGNLKDSKTVCEMTFGDLAVGQFFKFIGNRKLKIKTFNETYVNEEGLISDCNHITTVILCDSKGNEI